MGLWILRVQGINADDRIWAQVLAPSREQAIEICELHCRNLGYACAKAQIFDLLVPDVSVPQFVNWS